MDLDEGARDPAGASSASPGATSFASTLRRAMGARGLSLRAIQAQLRDRGCEVGVATLSHWQSGARRPEGTSSYDVLRELEDILRLEVGELEQALGPSRRVHSPNRRSFAELSIFTDHPLAAEPEPELAERSGMAGIYLDAQGSTVRLVDRTLWQARVDGARDATVFEVLHPDGGQAPEVIGTLGCDIVDMESDPSAMLVRATLRLRSPLHKGDFALTERQHRYEPQADPDQSWGATARGRQAELIVFVVFDPNLLPARCRVTITTEAGVRSQNVHLNGTCATHAEAQFGPGSIELDWEW